MKRKLERDNSGQVDALLVHVMGAEEHEDRPHLRGRSIVWAAVYLAYAEKIPHLVFAGKHYWGDQGRLPLGEVTAREASEELEAAHLRRDLTVLTEWPVFRVGKRSITLPVVDTMSEVEAFLSLAQENNWRNLASISSETHQTSIEQLYERRDILPRVYSAEAVLEHIPGNIGKAAYAAHIQTIRESDDEKEFQAREKTKQRIYNLPFGVGERLLYLMALKSRQISTAGSKWSVRFTSR